MQTPAAVRFVSIEPMLGLVHLPWLRYGFLDPQFYNVLDWVIVGGESGPKARSMHPDWARSVRDQCQVAGVPFFFKQWGEYCWPEQMPENTWREVDASVNLAGIPEEAYRVGKKSAG